MKRYIQTIISLSLLYCMAFNAQAYSDESSKGKIKGTVVDSQSGSPIEFATIALIDPETSKPINGNIADAKGEFVIEDVEPGTYRVNISFIGYEKQSIDEVVLEDKKSDVNLGVIRLVSTYELLNDVEVTGQRDLIEEKVDRTVYNAENDKTTAGGDATDVLKRVPMLSVDMSGNVSLRGSQNIKVLINNKPSIIAASSIADALKMIPADQIKSVEVITSPSARYDAEGSAGIINIITKKNNMEGAMLNIRSSEGYRGTHLGLNGSFKQGKLGLTLGGFGRAVYNVNGSFENSQATTRNGQENRTIQNAQTRNNGLFGRYTLGMDYDINKKNFIIGSVQYGVRNNYNYQDGLISSNYVDQTLVNSTKRNSKVTDQSTQVDVSLDYVHLFETSQREWSVSTLYSTNVRTNDFLNTNFGDDAVVDSTLLNLNGSNNQEFTIQTDYITPISDKVIMEMGVKEIMRKVTSDYSYFHSMGSNGSFEEITDARSTNVFDYQQNVSAAYMSYTWALTKTYTVKAGARYEHTSIIADFQNTTESPLQIPSYGLVVPSFNISKKLANGNMVKMAFNRRIQRPSIQFLNPNVQASNPSSISMGNPNLKPEYTNNYEISYSTYIKKSSINVALFMRNTSNAIQSVRTVYDEGIILNTYDNIGEENAYGVNFNGSLKIGEHITINGGTDVYYATLDNRNPDPLYHASNQGIVASARLHASYSLPKGWEIESFTMFRGRQVQLQGIQTGFRIYNLGLQKQFNNKKGSLGFGLENFLTSGMVMKSNVSTPDIIQNSTNVYNNFSFKINFDYQIGKMSYDKQSRKKRGVKNTDMKEGGSSGSDN